MTNNNHISKIWADLEEEKTIGLVKRLYSSDVPFHIYGTFQYPERYYGVAFTFGTDVRIDISSFENLRGLKILLLAYSTFVNSRLLVIQLLQPNSCNVSLCENLIQSVIQLNSEQRIIRVIVNQLEKWKTLFEKDNSTKLTPAEQQVLYSDFIFAKISFKTQLKSL